MYIIIVLVSTYLTEIAIFQGLNWQQTLRNVSGTTRHLFDIRAEEMKWNFLNMFGQETISDRMESFKKSVNFIATLVKMQSLPS